MAETKTNIPVKVKIGAEKIARTVAKDGTDIAASNLPEFEEGSLIICKDTGNLYIDMPNESKRYSVGIGHQSINQGETFNNHYNSNCALADSTYAAGYKTQAGYNYFKVTAIDVVNKKITLGDATGLVAGLTYDILDFNALNDKMKRAVHGTISKIEGTVVTVDNLPENTNADKLANLRFTIRIDFDKVTSSNPITNQVYGNIQTNGGDQAYAIGERARAIGFDTFVGGQSNTAYGSCSSVLGRRNIAYGNNEFISGNSNIACGSNSAVFGAKNISKGNQNFTAGVLNTSDGNFQTVIGLCNDNKADTLFEVGNGTYGTVGNTTTATSRSNAFEVYLDGHAELQVQGTTDNSVATKKYVDDNSGAGKKFGTSEIFNDYENNITWDNSYDSGVLITDLTNNTVTLKNVEGLSVGGTFNIYDMFHSYTSDEYTITAIDLLTNKITFSPEYEGPLLTAGRNFFVVNSTATKTTKLFYNYAHAEGYMTQAISDYAHAEGIGTIAGVHNPYSDDGSIVQTAIGMYNLTNFRTILAVGNGTSNNARSNAFEVYRDGHAEVQKMGTTDNSVAIKKYVDDTIGNITTTEAEEHAQIDSTEILTAQTGTWVTDGWTGNATTGFTHTSGNTSVLKYPITGSDYTTEGTLYDITFSCSVAPTVDNIMVRIGNSNLFNLYGQEEPLNIGVKSKGSTDGTIYLEFIPSSTFTGTISNIKVHKITGTYVGKYKITDSNGRISFEVRADTNNKYNAFIGVDSGSYNTTGNGNAGFGYNALASNTSGFWNTGIGFEALQFVNAGSRNIGIGAFAGRHIETGQRNIAIGTHSLRENRTGNFNIAIGADSQLSSTSGEYNIGVGTGTLYYNNGSENIAIGRQAIASTGTSGQNNIAIGAFSLNSVQGDDNIAIGRNAGYGITTGTSNIIIGAGSGRNGNKNTVIGANSGGQLTENSLENTVIGYYSGTKLTNNKHCILIGNRIEGETTGDYQLNIGNLIKGSTQSSNKYVNIDGSLSAKSMSVDNVGTNDTDVVNKKYVDDQIGNINSILATMFNDVSTQSDEEPTAEEVIA